MEKFISLYTNTLYQGINQEIDRGEVYLIMPAGTKYAANEMSLEEAVLNTKGHNGVFVFTTNPLPIKDKDMAEEFVIKIHKVIQSASLNVRYMIWLYDVNQISSKTSFIMGVNNNISRVTSSLTINLAEELSMEVLNGVKIEFMNKESIPKHFMFSSTSSCIQFKQSNAPKYYEIKSASLAFEGRSQGCIEFELYIMGRSLADKWTPGFSTYFETNQLQHHFFPLLNANPLSSSIYWGFQSCIDPSDLYNQVFSNAQDLKTKQSSIYKSRRTYFDYIECTGKGESDQWMCSYYKTIYNDSILLKPVSIKEAGAHQLPARFTLNKNTDAINILLPEGDFYLRNSSTHNNYLLCGIEGTEYIIFNEGDILRCITGFPAYSPCFPLQSVSTVGLPVDLDGKRLDTTYTTSWISMISDKEVKYMFQPKGVPYYGIGQGSLLHHRETIQTLDKESEVFYPLIPYTGYKYKNEIEKNQVEEFERHIIGKERMDMLAGGTDRNILRGSTEESIATPNGYIADITAGGSFKNIYLANNEFQGKRYQLYFEEPGEKIIQAFQSNQLFLVVNNPFQLGKYTNRESKINEPAFHNGMNIEDWMFEFTPGQGNEYNNYKSVMIVKGCYGSIYDPEDKQSTAQSDSKSLIRNPEKWVEKEVFSSPLTVEGKADSKQLINLSTWMFQYCVEAEKKKENDYFNHFYKIITDPHWQGILFLNVPLEQKNLPVSLGGILCGLPEGASINLHHIGINLTKIKKSETGVLADGTSSLFGLIYYVDEIYEELQGPVYPTTSEEYQFQLLTLKVRFENSTVKKFENYAQLTMDRLFGLVPDHMEDGSNNNSMMLMGGYQNNNGNPSYSLKNEKDCLFYFQTSYLNKIEIINVQMVTVNDKERKYRFDLNGCFDFKSLTMEKENKSYDFDLFSYGNAGGADLHKQGLLFSNAGLSMTFQNGIQFFSFDIDSIGFDLKNSTLRAKSLCENLCLQLEGMVYGKDGELPADRGFIQVTTDTKLNGIQGEWYGLLFRLNMGTLGELASKAGLTSYILLAFSKEEANQGPNIFSGIQLPGNNGKTEFISLQNMLKLSIDQIWLMRDTDKESFLLLFTDIALKIFGMIKIPPGGSTMFYIFGDTSTNEESKELGWYAMYQKDQAKNL